MDIDALDELARTTGTCQLLLVGAGEDAIVGQVAGPPGVVRIDLSDPELFAHLDAIAALDSMEGQVSFLVGQALQMGMGKVQQGSYEAGYRLYRFTLYVAARTGVDEGIGSTVRNAWIVREWVRSTTERALGPTRVELEEQGIDLDVAATREKLDAILSMMAEDFRLLRPRFEARLAQLDATTPSHERVALLHALKRAADITGHVPRIEFIDEILALAQSLGEWRDLSEVILGELLQADVGGVLGLVRAEARDETPASVARAWELYQSLRRSWQEVGDLQPIAQLLSFTYGHLDSIRVRMTAAGGAFGHQLSYSVARLTRVVAADFAEVCWLQRRYVDAFVWAERAHSRAMTDWMGRTHGIRLPRQFYAAINPITGSANANEPASEAEIRRCAVDSQSAVLVYLAREGGYLVWLALPDGKLVPGVIAESTELLQELFRALPYTSEGETLGRSRRTRGGAAAVAADGSVDTILASLHEALLPERVRTELEQSTSRLVVIADGLLEYVPFAALRTSRRTAIVEEREVHYWPSITGWQMAERSLRVVAPKLPAVVVANSEFPMTYRVSSRDASEEISFDSLPGVLREGRVVADLLGVEPRFDQAATAVSLLELPPGIPVLHIATHGVLFQPDPEQSFLAMADRALSANTLYRHDRGIRAGLVVLSACQTGLGYQHPDSQIGLANAFLVAGARSVLSTLWEIPDDDTVMFMEAFYGALKQGATLPASVLTAQRALIAAGLPADSWAAFKVTGSMANPLPT